ncbi:hypothetical protein NM688_g7256 [Phlebia brevispora]|uniref:Uncharacterized protein n=1 Tax=Phlebia brevispora TaxID=194682 RepID=A0ACC1S7F7_9APHY|nr:hypothetical protein NM688_g7256 [Phlebia brevispora]
MLPELIFGGKNAAQLANVAGNIDVNAGWNAQLDLLEPSSNPEILEAFIEVLLEEIAGKVEAGFPVTVTDLWARSLARHFCNGTTLANFFNPNITHGAGITLSEMISLPNFKQHLIPFPIIVADSLSKFQNNKEIIPGNSAPLTNPIYEFTPFEMGSYDPILAAFTPTKFLGSQNGECTTGFDQLAYIAGASSNIFNTFNISESVLEASPIGPLVAALNEAFPGQEVELDAAAVPNPFLGLERGTFLDSNQTMLTLVDGGSDGEISPLQPMLVKARGIDVIFVIDAPADTIENFTNGSSLISSRERAALFPKSYSFPPIPNSPNTFVSEGLVKRPTFFGCNSRPQTDEPLFIYIANGGAPLGQAPVTNISTMDTALTNSQIAAILEQVNDVATQGIPVHETQKDPEWPVCLACGVVDRAREKLGIPRTGVCAQCLERYCWS